jgi:regulator of replication initiation timing
MDKGRIYHQATGIEEQIGKLFHDISDLKLQIIQLLEENKNLSIENQHLRAQLEQLDRAHLDKVSRSEDKQKIAIGEGYDNLARIYHEGFHICNLHFGSLRQDGDCLFCLSFLNKE